MAQFSYIDVSFLTFQATVQVIFICFAGFVCTKYGLLPPAAQKYISLLNVNLFTPALIFSKLAPSLSLRKMVEVAVIPFFFAISTGVSFYCSRFMAGLLKLNVPETNYVTAMAVFGNSNSLPVSLTIALAYTLPNIYWDIVEDDTPDKVASRGILYLLIFQQLGQVLRWSWGYNTLLKKRTQKELEFDPYNPSKFSDEESDIPSNYSDNELRPVTDAGGVADNTSGGEHNIADGDDDDNDDNGTYSSGDFYVEVHTTWKVWLRQRFQGFMNFMNPPLYAMALSVVVASIPSLQKAFYVNNGFVQNTISAAIHDIGSVSIPLILIILGSNLCPNTENEKPKSRNYKKIIFGSLVSRMILPPIILLPIIALAVKYINLSILDDPIFLIVSFILTVAPPAIQLSQICQLNELFEQEMAGVLFWGYVVLCLPVTISIVVSSLEVLNWAGKLVV